MEGQALRELWARGRTRWPALALSFDDFAPRASADELDPANAEDLFLVVACLARVTGAVEAFRAEHAASIATFVRSVARDDLGDEIASQVLVDLLVGDDGTPRLAAYTGRGPLRAWLRMLTVRRALNAKRDTTRRGELNTRVLREAVGTATDPETAYLKQLYGAAFEQAFRDAVAQLAPADSTLLRLHFGEGLPLGALAAMHGWSKPTASRRIAAVREGLLTSTCDLLRARLKLSPTEVESVLRLIRSELDVSLAGLLQAPP